MSLLRARIIPALLMQEGNLVKTVNFTDPKYIGDPLNTVKIYNEMNVDELILFDINASITAKEPNFLH